MHPILIHALWLAASPALILLDHMALARLMRGTQNQVVAVAAILLTYATMGLLLWLGFYARHPLSPREIWTGAAYDFIVYSCIGYAYFHVFNMSETARRIRILREVYRAGSLTAERIVELYSASDVIDVRIQRLLQTRQIERRGERYVVIGRALYYVSLFVQAWRSLLGFEPFDQLKREEPAQR